MNTVEALYVYAEAAKQLIIRTKRMEFLISEVQSAGFSGIIQQTLVLQSPGLLASFLARADSFLLFLLACQIYYNRPPLIAVHF